MSNKKARTTKGRNFVFATLSAVVLTILALSSYLYFSGETENTERIPIAVVDFVNETDEQELDGLSGMLITALEQSRKLSVLSRSRMFDILRQLGKDDVSRIDETLGKEICLRANINAMAIASIRKFGEIYSIDLKIFNTRNDEYLLAAGEQGKGHESIPGMIDRLVERTRLELREKQDRISETSFKVETTTTQNLEAYYHFFKGEELINSLRFKEAQHEFRKALNLDSTFALAYYRLAYALNWHHDEGVEEAIQKALDLANNLPLKQQYLIKMLDAHIAGESNDAIKFYKETLRIDPSGKEALWMIGDNLYHRGEHLAARQYFEDVLAIDATFTRVWQHLIWTYQAEEDYDRVLEYAKQYMTVFPGEEAYTYVGSAYAAKGNLEKALEIFGSATELFPNSAMPILNIAQILISQDKFEEAEAKSNELINIAYDFWDNRAGHRMQSVILAYQGRFQDVEKLHDKLIAINQKLADKTDLARTYSELAFWSVFGRNDRVSAQESIKKGLESKGNQNIYFSMPLFYCYMIMGEFPKAHIIADLYRSLNPHLEHVIRGFVSRSNGKYEKAVNNFRKVMIHGLLPDQIMCSYYLAHSYFETGQYTEAGLTWEENIVITFAMNVIKTL